MATHGIRQQLHQQIDQLPDDVVGQVAEFTLFIMARRQIQPTYANWDNKQWQEFTLAQFFREADDVEYSLEDAQEIYQP
jgi:hypothetical protein